MRRAIGHGTGVLTPVFALLAVAAANAAPGGPAAAPSPPQEVTTVENPYEGIDWARCAYVHSMSHQHGGTNDASRREFLAMGYRHFAFSNYYPSAPVYPLPEDFCAAHPDVIACPNSEHHGATDASIHFNAPGSLTASGSGHFAPGGLLSTSPATVAFSGLTPFATAKPPGRGVYFLALRVAPREGTAGPAAASVTVEGGLECEHDTFALVGDGAIRSRRWDAGSRSLYLRASAPTVRVTVEFDPRETQIGLLRLMQGANRPWRDAFRAILDGEVEDGKRVGGLLFDDGGGITLNHPTGTLQSYLPMLDFDPRVLGIEVWNRLAYGFGSGKADPNLHYYRMWDDILRTGRRCFGFFVKDHDIYGTGRNVLVLPDLRGMEPREREQAALRAYRRGAFFGQVTPIRADAAGKPIPPYDLSHYRFTEISLRRGAQGRPESIAVAVDGNDPVLRPQRQIRFITERGVAAVFDSADGRAAFALPEGGCRYVRVEAFAYPALRNGDRSLSPAAFRELDVYQIRSLSDHAPDAATPAPAAGGRAAAKPPVVEMIFSQPIRFVSDASG
ncbi:MAG: hypothetical protein HY321_19610 [Armatimonadetes bacterium]|nr:hypothetical protein [Armatimonadota bacterium]